MQIDQIILLIENKGITFLVTVGVLYYMFKLANLFYGSLETKIIKNHAKDLKENWQKTIEKNTIIHQLLYKALYEFRADRAYVFEYHNGGHSISGIDFLKCSNTFEVVNERISPKQFTLQNLPVSMFAYWNMKILNRDIVCVEDVDDFKDKDLGVWQIMKQQDIKSIYMVGLYDAQGNPIGFFGLEYTLDKMLSCNTKMKHDLEVLSYKIAGLLY